jgi:glycine betaine/choline ABC-type transport system substrate-binding protein
MWTRLITLLGLPAFILSIALAAGCSGERQPLVVGGKQSPQNQIVAEMLVYLAEEAGIPVTRRIGLGATRQTLEAMKRGEIDVYPEYTGSGLAMLGLGGTGDADTALALVRERFAPLGLAWSAPLGFDNGYALAMLGDRARALGIRTLSDLAQRSERLVLGVEDEFALRPVDGLEPLLRRYGMHFDRIVEVPVSERMGLYDALIERRIDVALVYATDGQVEDFELRVLDDDLGFFPVYEATLLYREQALERFPALAGVFAALAGSLSAERMRALSRRVTLRGEDPAEVARGELARLGLADGGAAPAPRQALHIAVSPSANADGEAAVVLRALRRSFPTRNAQLLPASDPLGEVEAGQARVALVSAPAFFSPGSIDPETGQPPLRSGVEAVALVGNSYLHAFALAPEVGSLRDAAFIATSAEGSSGHRAAQSLIDALGLDAELVPVVGDDAGALADALIESNADAAVLMQPIGNWTVLELLDRGYALLSIDDWNQGNNRLVFPYLQPAKLTAADYAPYLRGRDVTAAYQGRRLEWPVETLVTQLVLAGPAPPTQPAIGNRGPGASFMPQALPLTDASVERINAALAVRGQINPILPQAAALAPKLPGPPAPINPSPAVSLLSVAVIAMLVWMGWLLLRGAPPPRS